MKTYADFRPLFAEAIDTRLYSLDYLDSLVLSGRAQCWFSDRACIVTEIREYPSGALVIHGIVAAGDMKEIVETLIPRAEEWGRSVGCVLAIIESREGWARALKPHGWETHQVSLRKEL